MVEITRERRANIRLRLNDYAASMKYAPPSSDEIEALLDAADERDRLREARTWLLFAGSDYYPSGGAKDFIGTLIGTDRSRIMRSAVAKMRGRRSSGQDWWHIFCVETDECLMESEVIGSLQYEEDNADAPL